MPEIVEVELLRSYLERSWVGDSITAISSWPGVENPTKYLQNVDWKFFVGKIKDKIIEGVYRKGKYLLLQVEGEIGWVIHLNSTGWFEPANDLAKERSQSPDWSDKFIHSVSEKTRRLRLTFTSGQVWDYHDSRTWGKWYLFTDTQNVKFVD